MISPVKVSAPDKAARACGSGLVPGLRSFFGCSLAFRRIVGRSAMFGGASGGVSVAATWAAGGGRSGTRASA